MSDCIFCKIIRGEIPSNKVYENDQVLAFHDIAPQAPVHVLIIPKTHLASADEVSAENSAAVAAVFEAIPEIAKKLGVQNAYRLINNCGEAVGQTVHHLHFHLLAGTEKLSEKLV